MTPEAKLAARRQLAIDLASIALKAVRDKLPALEAAVAEHGQARVRLSFEVERWTPPPNKREPEPSPRLRATVRVGKDNAIVTLTADQAALFGGSYSASS